MKTLFSFALSYYHQNVNV